MSERENNNIFRWSKMNFGAGEQFARPQYDLSQTDIYLASLIQLIVSTSLNIPVNNDNEGELYILRFNGSLFMDENCDGRGERGAVKRIYRFFF